MLFERFRKPKWQHRDPSVRRQAILQLSPRDAVELALLTELACSDSAPEVRRSAVKCLSDLVVLRERADHDPDAGVREAAAVRYRQLLAGGAEGMMLRDRIRELEQCDDPLVLAHLARGARDPELRIAALARIDRPNVLEDAAAHDPQREVREAALSRISDPEALARLERGLRQEDKRLARRARERLAQLQAVAEEEQRLTAERTSVLNELQLHAEAVVDPAYSAATDRLENRWQALATGAAEAEAEQVTALLEHCRRRAAEAPGAEQALALVAQLAERLARASEPVAHDLLQLRSELDEAVSQWQGALAHADQRQRFADDCARLELYLAQAERYLLERDALQAELEQLAGPQIDVESATGLARQLMRCLDAVAWDPSWPRPPLLDRAQEALAWLQAQLDEEATRKAEQIAVFDEALAQLQVALEFGELRAARGDLKKAQSVLEQLPAAEREVAEQRLRPLQARVHELRDWRQFATLPKQEALCRQMEALEQADLDPAARAVQIRRLQAQWQATGGSDSAEARQLWERFQAAGERAFELCRAYFAAQERHRAANLARRQAIHDQLARFIEQADWERLETDPLVKIREQARHEWQVAMPVDREAGKPLEQSFEHLMQQLTRRIGASIDRRREARQRLLQQAKAAAAEPELAAAIDQIKALQQEWRALGRISSAVERRQADAFRAICDEVFGRRGIQQRGPRDRVAEANLQVAREWIDEARELLGCDDGELMAALTKAGELADRLDRTEPLPGGERLREELAMILRQLGRRRQAQLDARSGGRWQRLHRRAELCAELEALAQAEGDIEQDRLTRLEAEWLAQPELPPSLGDGVARRWQLARAALRAGGFEAARLRRGSEQRRRLCVRLEILAGLASPPEDQALRLELEAARSIGAASGGKPAVAAAELLAAWYAAGPAAVASREVLEARLQAALAVVMPAD